MSGSDADFEATHALVRGAQAGDAAALELLFARYLPRTVRMVSLRMGKRLAEFAEYEDVAQEALMRVFQSLEVFESQSEASFRNWVGLCVEREIRKLDRFRTREKRGGGKTRRFGDFLVSGIVSRALGRDSTTPSELAASRESEEVIESALLELEPHHRELIIERHFCGMSYAEIARQAGLDESTVRRSCRRAEARLAERLG